MGHVPTPPELPSQSIDSTQDTLHSEKESWKTTPSASQADSSSPGDNDMQLLVDRTRELNYNVPDAVIPTTEETSNNPYQRAMGLSFATFGDVIVQDGQMAAQLRTKYFSDRNETPIRDLKGQVSKTRFFGQSHWMHAFTEVPNP